MVRKIKEKNDWDPWIKLQQSEDFWKITYDFSEYSSHACKYECEFYSFIEVYPNYMRKAAILAMSVAKWHYRNSNRGKGYCAACLVHTSTNHLDCHGCLAEKVCGTYPVRSLLFNQFCQEKDPNKKRDFADQIYAILRKDYDKELAKVEKREKGKN